VAIRYRQGRGLQVALGLFWRVCYQKAAMAGALFTEL